MIEIYVTNGSAAVQFTWIQEEGPFRKCIVIIEYVALIFKLL